MLGKRFVLVLLVALLAVSVLVIGSQPASASHWCSPLTVSRSPSSGYAGDAVNVGIALTNGISDSLDVSAIAVTFSWSSTTWNWGTMNLGPYASATNTYSVQLPSTVGDYTISITVTGQATGDWFAESCGPFTGTFRVNALPPPPTVTATANPTTGSTPLTVNFQATVSQGLAPFTYSWTFGDGGTGNGASTSHTYTQPGTYTAEVVVTDSRGRSTSDTVAITVQSAISGALGSDVGIIVLALIIVVAVVAVAAVLLSRKRRVPPMSPQPPAQPPMTLP